MFGHCVNKRDLKSSLAIRLQVCGETLPKRDQTPTVRPPAANLHAGPWEEVSLEQQVTAACTTIVLLHPTRLTSARRTVSMVLTVLTNSTSKTISSIQMWSRDWMETSHETVSISWLSTVRPPPC